MIENEKYESITFNPIPIQEVSGGGKTQFIIDNCDAYSLIVTYTITLSEEIKRRSNSRCRVIHYHQLIWDTGKQIGMPLSLGGTWGQYDNEFVFEEKKNLIPKYSKIFIDIENDLLSENWIKILRRYFLKENGDIFISKEVKDKKSFRLNNKITTFINSITNNHHILPKNNLTKHSKVFYVPSSENMLSKNINQMLKKLSVKERNSVTILASNLDVLQNLEETIVYAKHISFVQLKEEKGIDKKSLDYHWMKKNKHLEFNPNSKKLKMATLESFKGLESEIIFYIFTQNDSLHRNLYTAITRASDKVFIFNAGSMYSDKIRLYVDEIVNENESLKSKIYLALIPGVKEKILKQYFSTLYEKLPKEKDLRKKLLNNNYTKEFNLFFQRIFPDNQKLQVMNYGKKNNVQKLAITHSDTNTFLIVEQSESYDRGEKHNYFLCERLEGKSRFIFSQNEILNIDSCLIVPEKCSSYNIQCDSSEVKIENTKMDIAGLLEKIEEYPPIIPIEETPEFKKWQTYLELLKKSKIFDIKNIEYQKNIAVFQKTKKVKLEKGDILAFNDEYRIKVFGSVEKVKNNTVYMQLSKDIKDEDCNRALKLGLVGDLTQVKKLQNGMQKIKTHKMRYYIFGDQKLPKLVNHDLNLKFKNKLLNDKQKEAIKKALVSENIFMIQGPPGTGKTSVICELAYQEIINGKKVLISSESNDAVENALEYLLDDRLFSPILFQSHSRRKKETIKKELPLEHMIGSFYKKRILDKLKNTIDFLDTELIKYKKAIDQVDEQFKTYMKLAQEPDSKYDILMIKKQHKKSKSKILEKYTIDHDKLVFENIQKEFYDELTSNEECEEELKEYYIKKVNLVGATLNQIDRASREIIGENEFDVVIVDEVSKATPIELNLAILKGKKVILVGDQKQLPPMLDRDIELREFADSIFKTADKNEKEVLSELHGHKTVFEKLIMNNPGAHIQLITQYRMHKDIQQAINQFYDEPLECGVPSNERVLHHQLFESKSLVWIDPSNSTESKNGTSFENKNEIQVVDKILECLNGEYQDIKDNPTVGVISFYGKQVQNLNCLDKLKYKNLNIDFGTVDTFQGQERDFIVVSMVRSNDRKDIGFARSPNRINVAFSRAKKLLVILGSVDTFTIVTKNDTQEKKNAKKIYQNIYELSHKDTI